MKLFDTHCDTAVAIYKSGSGLYSNDFHISLEKASVYSKYVQLAGIFTSPSMSDEDGWQRFLAVRENFAAECEKNNAALISSGEQLEAFEASDRQFGFVFAVEDARILAGKIERVKEMYDLGVRCVTLLWGGETIIGGSHNTELGLSDFGKEAVREMCRVGIIPDISHASFKAQDEIMDICEEYGTSPIATHMNSYDTYAHTRNLTDARFRRLVSLGGIAGVSLCVPHLSGKSGAEQSAEEPAEHIAHYCGIAPHGVGFGCDYDGTDLPSGLENVGKLVAVADRLRARGMTEAAIEDIYYNNMYAFMRANLK